MNLDFFIFNEIDGTSRHASSPPGRNPVRVGRDPRNDVVLESNFVARQHIALSTEGDGWVVWLLDGHSCQVGDRVLATKYEHVKVEPGVVLRLPPFVLTVRWQAGGRESEAGRRRRHEEWCAELVRQVHRELNVGTSTEPGADGSGEKQPPSDEYVLRLENHIDALVAARPELPRGDLEQTELGDFLAGQAVRSELIRRLIDRSGLTVETFKDGDEAAGWGRLRSASPAREREVDEAVRGLESALGLGAAGDLSEQMRHLGEQFWPAWGRALAGVSLEARRYLLLRRIKKEIKDIWFGYGPLEDLLDNPAVTEIMVVDRDHIFLEMGGSIEDSGRRFVTDPATVIEKIVSRVGRRINTSEPLVNARLRDGSRVNAVLPPLAVKGPCLTIRRFPTRRLTADDLVANGSLSPAACQFLRAAVLGRRNVLVSGGTGTGKTTLLNCLSGFIPDKERIVTIEDTAELQLHKEHVVTLEARPKNAEGAGEYTIGDLVRNALRMRPDRIVVGECRGGEALDMLQAMNTGHDGSMTTVHANSPADVVGRLEVMAQQGDAQLPVEAIHRQIASAVDLIVHLQLAGEGGKKRRVVAEVAEVLTAEEGGVRLKSLFGRPGGGGLRPTGYLPSFAADLLAAGFISDPLLFVQGLEAGGRG